MSHLIPCPECGRHVRNTEAACPFCALPLDLSGVPAPQLPSHRLSRAATLAFTATLASATALAACSGTTDGGPDPDPVAGAAGMPSAGVSGIPAGGGAVAVYGAPPAGSGNDGGTAGFLGGTGGVYGAPAGAPNNGGSGGDAATAGSSHNAGAGPVYGAPPPQD